MKLLSRNVSLPVLWVVVASAGVQAQEVGVDWVIERMTRDEAIKPGMMVEVLNEYGDVRARATDEAVVKLSAMVQQYKGDDQRLAFHVERDQQKLVVKVTYPGKDDDTVKAGGKRRADVTVFVPRGSLFRVRTGMGLIEAKGIRGDVDLHSERGNIFVRTDGHPMVSADQGNITAILLNTDWEQPARFESVVGDISITLPTNASITVEAETPGELTTDYSVEVARDPKTWIKTATAKIGTGQSRMKVTNKRGAIKLLLGKWDVQDH